MVVGVGSGGGGKQIISRQTYVTTGNKSYTGMFNDTTDFMQRTHFTCIPLMFR